MPIEPEAMRSCLLEALRRSPKTQYESLKHDVAAVVAERNAGEVQRIQGGGSRLLRTD